ncbi:MAG: hypothetical protein JNK05_16930 [Myxococcales bacterium]|nr:hypothetical protein [Myxococcales bacterium]
MKSTRSSATARQKKQSAAGLLAIARAARLAGARASDLFYETIGRMIETEAYEDVGYETAEEFCEAECHEPERTVSRKVRVARYATKADWDTYGSTKLDATLAYVEAVRGAPLGPKDRVDFDAVRVVVKKAGKETRVSIAKLDAEAIAAAASALTKKPSKKPAPSPSEGLLRETFAKTSGLDDAEVSVRDGRATITFALAHKDKLAEALYALPDTARERGEKSAKKSAKKATKRR